MKHIASTMIIIFFTACKKEKTSIQTIRGEVFNLCTDSAMANIPVYLKGAGKKGPSIKLKTITDAAGKFAFENVELRESFDYVVYVPTEYAPVNMYHQKPEFFGVGGQQLNAADCNYFGSINNVSLSIGVNAHHIINLAQGVYNNNIPAGKVGINTAPPPGPELSMEIYGSLSIMNGGDVSLYLGRNNLIGSGTAAENYGEWGIQYLRSVSNNGHPGGLNFWKPWQSTGVSGNGFLFLSDNGNVGIGCLNPQYKLDVDGTVRAKEVRVKITGCDYVFDDKYKLEDLRKRKEKVLKEKHLPGLKNWNGENDMNLRELVEVLWKTIEEHELYIYQLEEEINELKKTNKN